jgi:3-methyladenine DNA glycosylase AlkD
MLDFYGEEEYLERIFKLFDNITSDEYYVQIAIAWAVSVFFIKCETTTMKYLRNNKLDKFTYNKSVQKIRESLRVNKETKQLIETMKR